MSKLTFYKTEDGKYSFLVEGDPNATSYLLKNTIKHKIKESGLFYAKKALEELLKKYNPNINYMEEDDNIVVNLNEYIQGRYGTSPMYSSPTKINRDNFSVELYIETSDMSISEVGVGRNQRLARQDAANKAAKRLNMITL